MIFDCIDQLFSLPIEKLAGRIHSGFPTRTWATLALMARMCR